jgi:N-acetylglucosaminyldiphosphoundecaprenol N-acetyl-beta-D-mannosaminyltransferase
MADIAINGVRLCVIDRDGLTRTIMASLEGNAVARRRGSVYAYINVHAVNLAQKDRGLREFLNRTADVTYCDGEGIRLGARILGERLAPRIVLTYYLWDLLARCEHEKRSVMFLGSSPGVVERAAENVRRRYPRLRIAGSHHGYFEKSGPESEAVLTLIGRALPDILFVGFGMPLQEHWIAANLSTIRAGAILPCGSMIEYAANVKSLAPQWMANHGLEWLYRLFQEPGRLWRRYLIGNPAFIFRIVRQRLREGKIR